MSKMKCQYYIPLLGYICKRKALSGTDFCLVHTNLCHRCGSFAVGGCENSADGLVCGRPLCRDCSCNCLDVK